MPIRPVDAGGVLRTITRMKVMDGTTLRPILRAKILDGATLRTVAQFADPVTLSVMPESEDVGSFTHSVMSSSLITATPTGGLGPFTYVWTITSPEGSANNPTLASTRITSGDVPLNTLQTVTATCQVTDSLGQTATDNVTVNFYYYSFGGY